MACGLNKEPAARETPQPVHFAHAGCTQQLSRRGPGPNKLTNWQAGIPGPSPSNRSPRTLARHLDGRRKPRAARRPSPPGASYVSGNSAPDPARRLDSRRAVFGDQRRPRAATSSCPETASLITERGPGAVPARTHSRLRGRLLESDQDAGRPDLFVLRAREPVGTGSARLLPGVRQTLSRPRRAPARPRTPAARRAAHQRAAGEQNESV
jgi:hypothetical protein